MDICPSNPETRLLTDSAIPQMLPLADTVGFNMQTGFGGVPSAILNEKEQIIKELEASGTSPEVIEQMREEASMLKTPSPSKALQPFLTPSKASSSSTGLPSVVPMLQ